jgi:hypothetical protein
MIHGLDTGFLVAAEVGEHAAHADARATLAHVLAAGDVIAIAPSQPGDALPYRVPNQERGDGTTGGRSRNVSPLDAAQRTPRETPRDR